MAIKNTERCLISLLVREIQTWNSRRHHHTQLKWGTFAEVFNDSQPLTFCSIPANSKEGDEGREFINLCNCKMKFGIWEFNHIK